MRRFLDPLKAFEPTLEDEKRPKRSVAVAIPQQYDSRESSRHPQANPSAPPLYLIIENCGSDGYCSTEEMGVDRTTSLEEAIHHGWPYDPQYGQVAFPPFAITQLSLLIRVYRDPTQLNYTTGLEQLPDDVRQ